MLLLLGTIATRADEAAPVQAIWKPQEFTFYYQSFTTFYSCESLENKLEQILRQMGVKAQVRVRSVDCGRGPVRFPQAEIQLLAPVEATPEALEELKKGESKRELIARVSGDRAKVAELTEQFPAQWQRVTIGRWRGTASLEGGDCELLDQVKRKILPKLAVRVVEDSMPCPASPNPLVRPTLVVDALIPMPKPDDAPAN